MRNDILSIFATNALSPSPSFSGSSGTRTITWWHRDSPEAPEPLAQSTTYKSLKYHVYCVTVGFRTVAAANPTRTFS